jgi:hypothetical protein
MRRFLIALGISLGVGAISVPAAAAAPPDHLKIIHSNLSDDRKEKYDGTNGWPVRGKGSFFGLWIMAMPFIPNEDSTIWRIKLALEWNGDGDNAVMISVRADADGVPGQLVGKVQMTDLPRESYSCCEIGSVTLTEGIPVSAGTRYWLVVHAKGEAQFRWNYSNPHENSDVGYNRGSKWKFYSTTLGGFLLAGE